MKHDEIKDIALLKRKGCKFENLGHRMIIVIPRNTLGIKSWGRVDYLCKVYGATYRLVTSNKVTATSSNKSFRDIKKENKAPKLTNKKK